MAADADAMHDLVTIEADNDSEGLQRLVEGGHAFVIPAGTKAFSMEDVGEDTTKIRIEEGQYTGQEGIIQNELIHGIE